MADYLTGDLMLYDKDYNLKRIFSSNGKLNDLNKIGNELWLSIGDRSYIKIINLSDNKVSEFGQAGMRRAEFSNPGEIEKDEKYIYIADELNNRIQIFDKQKTWVKELILPKTKISKSSFGLNYSIKKVGLNFYDEIRVYNLSMRYMVWGDYHTTIGDDSKELMLVPLDKSITDTYSNKDNEELFQRSMHFVFNSRETRKVKWYQQDWFGDLLKVGAIVLTIATGFSEGGFLLEAASAVTASAYAVAAAIILTEIAIAYTVKVAFTLFVKMVGVDVAFIASLINCSRSAVVSGNSFK